MKLRVIFNTNIKHFANVGPKLCNKVNFVTKMKDMARILVQSK